MKTHYQPPNLAWFKATRLYLGLTMEEVAKMMNCTKQTISNIEKGAHASSMSVSYYETVLNNLLKSANDFEI